MRNYRYFIHEGLVPTSNLATPEAPQGAYDQRLNALVGQRSTAHIKGMKRIAVECLSCGHCSSFPEERLKAFGVSPDAPIAKFIKRLTCIECGSHSVRAYRYDLQDAG